ncbi:competence protein CoiA [Virgibacillus flavescens]|uniref:competence protein CoiA n=1 Tax=Virgibacillus flavescens TaxID=1611422 RepID=UPI003D34B1A6
MLQAKIKTGDLITLINLTKQEVENARHHEYFCPVCNESVIVKAGERTIAHFAHLSVKNCISSDYGEGSYHARGKLELYNWLKQQTFKTELEKYIPEINQRPDLLVTIRNKKIAIEYQCARIPLEVVRQRNEGYRTAGITPIWILGAKHFHRLRKHHFKVDQFILSFLHQFTPSFPISLYFFCPSTLQFVSAQHIHLSNSRNAIGSFSFSKLNEMTFHHMFKQPLFNQNGFYQLWLNEKKQFRLSRNNRMFGAELVWHKWLYENGTHKERLPSIVHLPVPGQHQMKLPLYNWQSRLCIDLLIPLKIGARFSIKDCERLLRYKPQQSILLKGTDHPILSYLLILKEIGVIDQYQTTVFVKMKEIVFHKNIEESVKADARLMNQLIQYSTIGL